MRGDGEKYVREVVLKYEGDECLRWPYGQNGTGYGVVKWNKQDRLVSRLVCEEIHGPPPTPEHEAAHSCGNGHLACCTPRHLSWKTSKENKDDMLRHGTRPMGDSHYTRRR